MQFIANGTKENANTKSAKVIFCCGLYVAFVLAWICFPGL